MARMKLKRLKLDLPRTDGLPRRAYSAVNARFDEKHAFDHLHTWWRLSSGEDLSQIDAFSRVLALALDHPDADAPADLVRRSREKKEKKDP